MTKQRQIILDCIRENCCRHLSAIEIFDLVRAEHKISLATVYNSLNYLVDNGHILRVQIAGEPDRFDGNLHAHHHAICDVCGSIIDVNVPGIIASVEDNYGVKVTDFSLNLHCICKNCQNINAK